MADDTTTRYQFGPLEHRGLIGGLRATQVGLLAAALVAAVGLLYLLPTGTNAFAALGVILVAAALAFWPLRGRSLEEWAPVAVEWLARERPPSASVERSDRGRADEGRQRQRRRRRRAFGARARGRPPRGRRRGNLPPARLELRPWFEEPELDALVKPVPAADPAAAAAPTPVGEEA